MKYFKTPLKLYNACIFSTSFGLKIIFELKKNCRKITKSNKMKFRNIYVQIYKYTYIHVLYAFVNNTFC